MPTIKRDLPRIPHGLDHANQILDRGTQTEENIDDPLDGVLCLGGALPGDISVFADGAELIDVVVEEELEDVGYGEDVLVGAHAAAEGFRFERDEFPGGGPAGVDGCDVGLFDEVRPGGADVGHVADVGLVEEEEGEGVVAGLVGVAVEELGWG